MIGSLSSVYSQTDLPKAETLAQSWGEESRSPKGEGAEEAESGLPQASPFMPGK